MNQFIEPPAKLMYKRPGSSEYERLPDILDEILNRLEKIENSLDLFDNDNETIR